MVKGPGGSCCQAPWRWARFRSDCRGLIDRGLPAAAGILGRLGEKSCSERRLSRREGRISPLEERAANFYNLKFRLVPAVLT
jgi:hypothetical protein